MKHVIIIFLTSLGFAMQGQDYENCDEFKEHVSHTFDTSLTFEELEELRITPKITDTISVFNDSILIVKTDGHYGITTITTDSIKNFLFPKHLFYGRLDSVRQINSSTIAIFLMDHSVNFHETWGWTLDHMNLFILRTKPHFGVAQLTYMEYFLGAYDPITIEDKYNCGVKISKTEIILDCDFYYQYTGENIVQCNENRTFNFQLE